MVECHVKAQSEPTCLWYKEQTIVQKSSKHTVNITKVSEVINEHHTSMPLPYFWILICPTQGEYAVQLEISEIQQSDKGVYKLVAKNQKGEAISKTVEVKDIPEEEKAKPEKTKKPAGEKPTVAKQLQKTVINHSINHSKITPFIIFYWYNFYNRLLMRVNPLRWVAHWKQRTRRLRSHGWSE